MARLEYDSADINQISGAVINQQIDRCPGCGTVVSALKHDFSLCTQLQNALYRIRELETKSNVA